VELFPPSRIKALVDRDVLRLGRYKRFGGACGIRLQVSPKPVTNLKIGVAST